MAIKYWDIRTIDPAAPQRLCEELGLPALAGEVLCARGYDTPEKAQAFLQEDAAFGDPFSFRDMDKAVERVSAAIENFERIAVYGDYDCDGVTSTALLYSYLETVGADVLYYIPDREGEGYGMNCGAVDRLAEQDVSLIITVDNGISAKEEIAYAASLGIDVVVTDHHQPPEELPPAVAVVDPHRADCPSGTHNLSGVGVAFQLICALEGDDGGEMLDYYGDLVTIGLIGDVMELTGQCRALVKRGLSRLGESERPGIQALLEVAGIAPRTITATSVAFGLVPRINAAGRLGETEAALRLLLTDDPEEAAALAQQLEEDNRTRKEIEQGILREAESLLARNPQLLYRRVLVLSGKGWHHGVIGIVCARLVEKHGKPCILIAEEGEEARGSGRSVEGFSLIGAIAGCKEHLLRYGGHTMAAGLSLAAKDIPAFAAAIEEQAREMCPLMPPYALHVDRVLDPSRLTVGEFAGLSCLEPFGSGNEYPLFALSRLRLEQVIPMGGGKHLRLRLSKDGNGVFAVYFGMAPEKFPYQVGDVLDFVATIDRNYYNGECRLSVKIKDIRLSSLNQKKLCNGRAFYDAYRRGEELPIEKRHVTPSREDVAVVYRYVRGQRNLILDYDLLYSRLVSKEINYCKMRIILDILEELGLVDRRGDGTLSLAPASGKVDLGSSAILKNLQG